MKKEQIENILRMVVLMEYKSSSEIPSSRINEIRNSLLKEEISVDYNKLVKKVSVQNSSLVQNLYNNNTLDYETLKLFSCDLLNSSFGDLVLVYDELTKTFNTSSTSPDIISQGNGKPNLVSWLIELQSWAKFKSLLESNEYKNNFDAITKFIYYKINKGQKKEIVGYYFNKVGNALQGIKNVNKYIENSSKNRAIDELIKGDPLLRDERKNYQGFSEDFIIEKGYTITPKVESLISYERTKIKSENFESYIQDIKNKKIYITEPQINLVSNLKTECEERFKVAGYPSAIKYCTTDQPKQEPKKIYSKPINCPFNQPSEENEFRQWLNKNYPEYSKTNGPLDKTGIYYEVNEKTWCNNAIIKAWNYKPSPSDYKSYSYE
jgi:hypothetical protein